ncbi:hypothetical protein TL16_g00745 [Triparma laevis f. inornata]|uniref:PH domain-containing protein n=1 Tax=Triparma laevis f. inornata TaxID=1714386 RepID=A0A9W7DQ79_9STRA|nr:hypothetical protein TL16_g00745 [Triparma laevis f. inornata]
MGEISREEFEAMELADRRFNAFQIVDSPSNKAGLNMEVEALGSGSDIEFGSGNSGWLMYKRGKRRKYRRKPWKRRFFVVAERMLFCFDKPHGTLRRAMPLESAIIEEPHDSKHPFYFEVHNQNYQFLMRGTSASEVKKWVGLLEQNAKTAALFSMALSPSNTHQGQSLVSHLSPQQRARYQFFKGERDFVRSLCEIAEELRFEPREDRKALAPQLIAETPIPPCAYIPMIKSTDKWLRVLRMLPNEARVFSTKERCPVLMCFEMQFEDDETDVANYLHSQYGDEGVADGDEMSESFDAGNCASPPLQSERLPSPPNTSSSLGEALKQKQTLPPSITAGGHQQGERKSLNNGMMRPGLGLKQFSRNLSNAFANSPMGRMANKSKNPSSKSYDTRKTPSSPSSQRGNVWKDEKSEFSYEEHETTNSSVGSNKSPTRERKNSKTKMNVRVQKFIKDMPQVSMPKALKNMNHKKKFNSPEYRKVKIYKSQSDAGVDTSEVSTESLNRAKRFVCGGENWSDKCIRLRETNAMPDERNVVVNAVIAKSNDDVRQEVFVMQMIHYYQSVWKDEGMPIFLKPYKILSTSKETGLIELLKDATR